MIGKSAVALEVAKLEHKKTIKLKYNLEKLCNFYILNRILDVFSNKSPLTPLAWANSGYAMPDFGSRREWRSKIYISNRLRIELR